MDIDRFKDVNDTLGHDVGDRLLREVGRRLRQVERGETVVARLGGDEFAVLLGGDDVHIEGMVARITRDMARPFDLGEVTLDVMASIGIAATPRDGSSAALLLRRAEIAMYDAKHGLTGVARYAADRDPYSSRRLSLIGDLARAVEEGTLELHYQPQAVPSSGQVTGVEALLRWNHPLWGRRAAGRVHPAGRAHRPDQAAHPAGDRDGGAPVRGLARGRHAGADGRQHLDAQPAGARAGRHGGAAAGAGRAAGRAAQAGGHRERDRLRPGAGRARAGAAGRPRPARLGRRLRHRLLLAHPAAQPAGARGEDRPLVRAAPRRARRRPRDRAGGHRPRPRPGPAGRRRGCRGRGAAGGCWRASTATSCRATTWPARCRPR